MSGWNATRANLAVRIMAAAISFALLAFPFGNGYAPGGAAQAHERAAAQGDHDHAHAAGHAIASASQMVSAQNPDCGQTAPKAVNSSCDEGNCAYGLCHAMVAVPAISFDRPPFQDGHMGAPAAPFVMLAGEMAERPPRA